MKKAIVFFFTVLLLQGVIISQEIKFYISPKGNDTWAGTSVKPFFTLQKARDAIRLMKSQGKLDRPVIVFLRGGLYELSDTFILKPEDSGSEKNPITYMAYPGEEPVITGSKQIVTHWKIYKDRIMVSSLPAEVSGKINFKQLFVNDKRQVRARTPDESYFKTDRKAENLKNTQIKFQEGDNRSWINVKNAELVLLNMSVGSRLFISGINSETRLINFTGPYLSKPTSKNSPYFLYSSRYYLENALQFLDKQNEWFLDFAGGKLYYYPSLPIDKSIIRVPVLQQLMKLEGNPKEKKYVQYVNFKNLTFTDTDYSIPKGGYPGNLTMGDFLQPSAISFEGTCFCTFNNNKIRNTGSYALEINGFGNNISDNEISYIGGGGIITRNYNNTPNTITYNSINNCGQIFPEAVGIFVEDGGGLISHNLIYNVSHSGISTKVSVSRKEARNNQDQPLTIEFNEIYKVMQKLNDGAGIFVQDSNIIIRNNLIYDVVTPAGGAPGWGIALGDRTKNTLVENNIVNKISEGLYMASSNMNNLIVNNIFTGSEDAMIRTNNESPGKNQNVRIIRNIFYFGNSDSYLYNSNGDNSLPSESDYNLFWNPYSCILLSPVFKGINNIDYIADWIKKRGFDKHSLVINPKFVDDRKNNFTLKKNSPAFDVGFKPIDISNVGLAGRGKP